MVIVAASGGQKALLEQEFPSISFIGLPGYDIKYGKYHAFTVLKILLSIPKILIRIKRENAWFQGWIGRERPDAVISDNRYGLYARAWPDRHDGSDGRPICVFMTHQLAIRSTVDNWPGIGELARRLLRRSSYRFIDRFSMCWVPDHSAAAADLDTPGFPLAGELSHPDHLPHIPVRYIGPLTRFKPLPAEECIPSDLVVLISGPEPQRSVFEKMMRDRLKGYKGAVILVRGLPGPAATSAFTGLPAHSGQRGVSGLHEPGALRVFDHLPAVELNRVLCGTALVISRPGYSSVMDLFKLNKRCIFVPTPGQTEQQYLGKYLSAQGLAVCVRQSRFDLARALDAAAAIREPRLPWDPAALTGAITGLIQKINERNG